MSTLNGISLNPNMIWLERFQPDQVAMSMRRTLGGRAVVFSGPLLVGEKITLEATSDHGWLKKEVVMELIALANAPNTTYVLEYGEDVFTVMFDHTRPPAVEFSPFVARELHEDGDYFVGQIKLITI